MHGSHYAAVPDACANLPQDFVIHHCNLLPERMLLTSQPEITIQRAILHCLGEVILSDLFYSIEVGNRPAYFEYSVIGSRGKPELDNRAFEQLL